MDFKRTVFGATALLMTALYLLSIVGFDVHQDKECGRVWVRLLLEDNRCSAIHPNHHHNSCKCCHIEAETEGMSDKGCTDSSELLFTIAQVNEGPVLSIASAVAFNFSISNCQGFESRCMPGICCDHHSSGPPPRGRSIQTRCCVFRV